MRRRHRQQVGLLSVGRVGDRVVGLPVDRVGDRAVGHPVDRAGDRVDRADDRRDEAGRAAAVVAAGGATDRAGECAPSRLRGLRPTTRMSTV